MHVMLATDRKNDLTIITNNTVMTSQDKAPNDITNNTLMTSQLTGSPHLIAVLLRLDRVDSAT